MYFIQIKEKYTTRNWTKKKLSRYNSPNLVKLAKFKIHIQTGLCSVYVLILLFLCNYCKPHFMYSFLFSPSFWLYTFIILLYSVKPSLSTITTSCYMLLLNRMKNAHSTKKKTHNVLQNMRFLRLINDRWKRLLILVPWVSRFTRSMAKLHYILIL